MAEIQRLRTEWTNFPGAPGVSTFYATDASAMLNALLAFWQTVAPGFPSGTTVQTPNTGDVIDDATGELVGGWSGGTTAAVVGAATGVYAGPAGCTITWVSDGTPHGYRVKGRTYLVPLGGGSYQEDGSLSTGTRAAYLTAAQTLVTATAGNFKVWNRPRLARAADGSRPAVTARAGSSWDVISVAVPDKAAILTSRRAGN